MIGPTRNAATTACAGLAPIMAAERAGPPKAGWATSFPAGPPDGRTLSHRARCGGRDDAADSYYEEAATRVHRIENSQLRFGLVLPSPMRLGGGTSSGKRDVADIRSCRSGAAERSGRFRLPVRGPEQHDRARVLARTGL